MTLVAKSFGSKCVLTDKFQQQLMKENSFVSVLKFVEDLLGNVKDIYDLIGFIGRPQRLTWLAEMQGAVKAV